MKRTYADAAVGLLIAAIVLAGGIATWQTYRQWTELGEMGGHMGTSVATMHGTHPFWYLLGTVLVASVVAGGYVLVRDRIVAAERPASDRSADGGGPSSSGAGEDGSGLAPTDAGTDRRILDLLPEDERRILEPVIESPGLTQIELRDRSDFSKSKVSQTVTDLEKRGLVYREPQGRTYRVYPSEDLEADR